MRLAFRYDDFSNADWIPFEIDQSVVNLFVSLGIPLLLGIIPNVSAEPRNPRNRIFSSIKKDQRRLDLVRRGLDNGFEVALHGYDHQRTDEVDGSEFHGLLRQAQSDKIGQGLEILSGFIPGRAIKVFVPPWNSFDATTLMCLEEYEFSTLCGGDSLLSPRTKSLQFIPSAFSPADLVKFLTLSSPEDLARIAGNSCLVVTVHHYDFWDRRRPGFVPLETLAKALRDALNSSISMTVVDGSISMSPLSITRRAILGSKLRAFSRNPEISEAPSIAALHGGAGGLTWRERVSGLAWCANRGKSALRGQLGNFKRFLLGGNRKQRPTEGGTS